MGLCRRVQHGTQHHQDDGGDPDEQSFLQERLQISRDSGSHNQRDRRDEQGQPVKDPSVQQFVIPLVAGFPDPFAKKRIQYQTGSPEDNQGEHKHAQKNQQAGCLIRGGIRNLHIQ
jgi:hypothetical protein